MSLREKAAWIYLATILLIYGPYFGYVCWLIQHGRFRVDLVFNTFIDAVIAQAVLAAAAFVLFAFRNRKEPKDERDAALESRSFRAAYLMLAAGCFIIIMSLPLLCVGHLAAFGSREFVLLLASQILLLCFVVAEAVKYFILAVGYRRGI